MFFYFFVFDPLKIPNFLSAITVNTTVLIVAANFSHRFWQNLYSLMHGRVHDATPMPCTAVILAMHVSVQGVICYRSICSSLFYGICLIPILSSTQQMYKLLCMSKNFIGYTVCSINACIHLYGIHAFSHSVSCDYRFYIVHSFGWIRSVLRSNLF